MRRALAIATAALAAVAVMVTAPLGLAAKKKSTTYKRTAYGLTSGGKLIKFDATNPSRSKSIGSVKSLAAGERLVGIDFRPKTGKLIALSTDSVVYTVSTKTGKLSKLSELKTLTGVPVSLGGDRFDIDFNPTVDRLRVTSDSEENLRVNVDTGVTTVDTPLAYAPGDAGAGSDPSAVGAAYTNNDNDAVVVPPATNPPGATPTQLFVIDSARAALTLQNPPNDGVLNTVGSLGTTTTSAVGFDVYSKISGGKAVANTAYASLRRGGRTRLYTVDIATGKAQRVSGGGRTFKNVSDIAVKP